MTTTKAAVLPEKKKNGSYTETKQVTIQPRTWYPIDTWMQAYDAVRDPGGRYAATGLRGGWLINKKESTEK